MPLTSRIDLQASAAAATVTCSRTSRLTQEPGCRVGRRHREWKILALKRINAGTSSARI
jgi:hypothetical protein